MVICGLIQQLWQSIMSYTFYYCVFRAMGLAKLQDIRQDKTKIKHDFSGT